VLYGGSRNIRYLRYRSLDFKESSLIHKQTQLVIEA